MLKQMLDKVRELFNTARKWMSAEDGRFDRARYTGVPMWRPCGISNAGFADAS